MSKAVCLIISVLCNVFVVAQQYNIKNYSVWDGLAQSQVYDLVEDDFGNIWMATWGGGLSRFDGINFHTYTTEDGISSNYVESLCKDDKGNIWIGTRVGLSCYNGRTFVNFELSADSSAVRVNDLDITPEGTLWIATDSGLYRMADGAITRQLTETIDAVWCIYVAANGVVWFGTDEGLHGLDGQEHVLYTRDDGLSYRKVRAINADDSGRLLVGTYGGGLDIFENGNFESLAAKFDLLTNIVQGITVDDEGVVWMATLREGVMRWNPTDSTVNYINETDGLVNNHIRSILQDSWGNIWIGSSGGGVSKYIGQTFVHFTTQNGLAANYVYSVLEDSQGRLWMGTGSEGITRFDSASISYFNADTGFFNVKCKVLFEDSKGHIWLGTEGKGLVCYSDSTGFTSYTGRDGLSDTWIRSIDEDSRGRIWVATAGGGITILSWNQAGDLQTETIRASDGLTNDQLYSIHIDTNDVAWYGTFNKGMGYIVQDTLGTIIQRVPGIVGTGIRSLVEDEHGYLWIGTDGSGINRLDIYADHPEAINFTQADGLISNNIYLICFDQEGSLWLGSEKGVDQVYLDVERNPSNVKHFGQQEGFVGVETCQNAVCRSADGNLWFGTINGLTRYNPAKRKSNTIPPRLSIQNISLFYESLSETKYADHLGAWGTLVGDLILPYNENHLGFEFFGVNHSNPEQVRYQWMLKGYDQDWTPINALTNATYSNLPPGSYTFLVRSYNEDGVWNEDPVSISFTILPPYWETWWFRIAAAGTAFLILVLLFNWRIRAYRAKSSRIRERLKLEKEMVQLEQKALRLQMNPHFIFNSLNSIQGLITKKDDKSARYFLAKFSRLMRQILENSRESVITLEEEIISLENYMSLEQFSRGDSFEFKFRLDHNVDPEVIEVPPMMIQPFIENSIIHGLKNIDHKGLIEVAFKRETGFLECSITDNGIGRVEAAKMKAQQDSRHKSTALIVTQERLDHLSTNDSWKSLEIIDLYHAAGSAKGTRVVLRIPL